MNKRAQLLYDFICKFKGLAVNRESCLIISKTPELQYLLKHKFIERKRNPRSFSSTKTTVLYPVIKREVSTVSCPDCKANLTKSDFNSIFNPSSWTYRKSNHKYNCSFRTDHSLDSNNKKQLKF